MRPGTGTCALVAVLAASIVAGFAGTGAPPAHADSAWEEAIRSGSKKPLHLAERLVLASREIEVDVAATARVLSEDASDEEIEFLSACLMARSRLDPDLRKLLVDRVVRDSFEVQEAACFVLASHATHDPAAGADLVGALGTLYGDGVDLLNLVHHWDLPICSTVFRPLLRQALFEGGVAPSDGWKHCLTLRPLFERMLHGTAAARTELLVYLSGVLEGWKSDPASAAWALDLLVDLASGELGEDGAEVRTEVGLWVGDLPREERYASSLSRAANLLADWKKKQLPGASVAWTIALAGLPTDSPEFDRGIRRSLADEDPKVRLAAVQVVARRGASPEVARLCLELLDPARDGHLALLIALRLDDPSLPGLVAKIGPPEAVWTMSKSKHLGPVGRQALRDLTGDELWQKRPWLWLVGADRLRAAGESVPHFWSRVTDLVFGLVANPVPGDEPGYVDPPGYRSALPFGRVLPPGDVERNPQAEGRIARGLENVRCPALWHAVELLFMLGVRSGVVVDSLRAMVADEKRPLWERLQVMSHASRVIPDEAWPDDVIWRALRSKDARTRAAGVRGAGLRLRVVGDDRLEAEIARLASSEDLWTCLDAIQALPPSSERLRRTLRRHARSPSPAVAAAVLDELEVLCSESGVMPWMDLLVDGLDAPFPGHADRAVTILLEDEENRAAVRDAIAKRLHDEASPRWRARAAFLLEEIEQREQ